MRIVFVGEALIDFTTRGGLVFQGHEGGAPTNSAVAAARMGVPVGFVTQLSRDLFGEHLLAHLQRNGIDTRFVLRSDAPSTLAFVERTPATNRYAFYMQGTADTLWAPAQLPALADECRFLQFGSIALLAQPAASRITEFVEAERGRRVLLFDPNLRPSLIPDMNEYRRKFGRWLAACDLLKLSDEDAAALSPDEPPAAAAQRWLAHGPRAVVLTHGAQGATLHRAGMPPMAVIATPVPVADTIGAGDTFAAGLSVALLEAGVQDAAQLQALADETWRGVLHFAATAAALNCTREGADPPPRAELDAALAELNHPLRASRAPSRGHRQRPGKARPRRSPGKTRRFMCRGWRWPHR